MMQDMLFTALFIYFLLVTAAGEAFMSALVYHEDRCVNM